MISPHCFKFGEIRSSNIPGV